ncbi:BsuPI-related putative proteinase inhibitor [Shewanella submarina]|uniref:Intracellular proteinase inhibitor BsuPI domain-containing protein n=1 Tax=Shewanella submarina TaxID=2016376 RepID=A0ABV7GIY7_9GAMM|nr:BsuPI-related putative proteinase inhibitor [Shewanella submarina]MCL1039188.1 BsuPI-related putative proteinase inhibitor [Shewanella submarina]
MRAGLALTVLIGLVSGCHAQPEASPAEKPQIKVVAGGAEIKPVSQQDYGRHPGDKSMEKETLLQGELALADKPSARGNQVMQLRVFNPQSYGVPIQFNSGMSADLWLLDTKGKRVWAWSNDMMFTQAIRDTSLAAGKTMTVSFEVPDIVMAQVKPGFEWQARFMGRSTESPTPLLNTISMQAN